MGFVEGTRERPFKGRQHSARATLSEACRKGHSGHRQLCQGLQTFRSLYAKPLPQRPSLIPRHPSHRSAMI